MWSLIEGTRNRVSVPLEGIRDAQDERVVEPRSHQLYSYGEAI